MDNEKVYQMPLAKVYPLLVNKAVRKGRTEEEIRTVIGWLTGYTPADMDRLLQEGTTYGDFFTAAPQLNPHRTLITGTVCGIRVENIEEPLLREIRYLDKLVDELAKGKALERILRKP